ncbi:hypothetical protein BH10BAC1_BH10BAC1_21680 [soil metagenome]
MLGKYQLPSILLDAFKVNLIQTFNSLNSETIQEEDNFKNELLKNEAELKKLIRKNMVEDDYDKEIFREYKNELEANINALKQKLNNEQSKISNLDNYVQLSVDVVQNISKYWRNNNLEIKKRIQQLIFPEGLSLDMQKRQYLTKKVNLVFELTCLLSSLSEGGKKNDNRNFLLSSSVVAEHVIKSNQFENDLIAVTNFFYYIKSIEKC